MEPEPTYESEPVWFVDDPMKWFLGINEPSYGEWSLNDRSRDELSYATGDWVG
jgi:hypothetical protein